MKILDNLIKEAILDDLKSQDKKGIIEELVTPTARLLSINHKDIVRVILEREKLGSTGIGSGIGIPHGKLKGIDSLILGFGLSRKGVNFDSLDGQPAHIFFLLISPENSAGLHLKLLAQLSKILKVNSFREKLLTASNSDEIYDIIRNVDEDF